MDERFRERMVRFNETTGVMGYSSKTGIRGGNHHPDRCYCQGDPNPGISDRTQDGLRRGACGPNGDTTPHKHYENGGCARCGSDCTGYVPHDEKKKIDLLADARKIVEEAARGIAA